MPRGASIEEYRAAFADVEPIELRAQVPAAQGTDSALKFEDYFAAVTEWSGGKITFDIAWSNAIAPPAEVDDALADGRIDIALVTPLTEPARYRANNALVSASFGGKQTLVVGQMQRLGWMTEVFYDTPEMTKEFTDLGVTPLLPMVLAGPEALICREKLADHSEVQITAGGTSQAAQISAFGGIPVSISYAELYESLERGVVACVTNNLMFANSIGIMPIAPHIQIGTDIGFGLTPATLAVGTDKWESLPLVAKQLLFDRLEVYMERALELYWSGSQSAIKASRDAGGSLSEFSPQIRAGLMKARDELMAGVAATSDGVDGAALAKRIDGSITKWLGIVEGLGYTDEYGYAEWVDWYSDGKIDLSMYMDRLITELFVAHRPG
ncbi:hypothetical protein [Pseudonocardia thermophila]|jgi:TRAP-type C4-dicarboxylate transport system, periplasmic component|uniref:hypothetical protein n=1 Tax=Pseudonocardia thermophila TaxID=1848 RepID=UPI00248EECB9|nr:hypothetical protein [Pseudonocardia thermophila]